MKKIMFNDRLGLTEAVLNGTKTMTRRIAEKDWDMAPNGEPVWLGRFRAPRFLVGETVAVAQNYETVLEEMIGAKGGYGEEENAFSKAYSDTPGWKNKMFVGSDMMPNRIVITDHRVERLQDISDEDCLKEGVFLVKDWRDRILMPFSFGDGKETFASPVDAFAALIDKVSGKGTWDRNPYVDVYSFRLESADGIEKKHNIMQTDDNIRILKDMVYGGRHDGEILADGTFDGYEVRAISYGTHPCCYVKLDNGHKYHGKDMFDVNVDVHGGITFSYETSGDGRWSDGWWIGWDYAHLGDYCYYLNDDGMMYTTEMLVEDIKDVVKQLESE